MKPFKTVCSRLSIQIQFKVLSFIIVNSCMFGLFGQEIDTNYLLGKWTASKKGHYFQLNFLDPLRLKIATKQANKSWDENDFTYKIDTLNGEVFIDIRFVHFDEPPAILFIRKVSNSEFKGQFYEEKTDVGKKGKKWNTYEEHTLTFTKRKK